MKHRMKVIEVDGADGRDLTKTEREEVKDVFLAYLHNHGVNESVGDLIFEIDTEARTMVFVKPGAEAQVDPPKFGAPRNILICGPQGVGKTLKANAIAREWRLRYPDCNVVVIETFFGSGAALKHLWGDGAIVIATHDQRVLYRDAAARGFNEIIEMPEKSPE